MKKKDITILLIKDGEIIPISDNKRCSRNSHLMSYFELKNYKNIWLSSNFDHGSKKFIRERYIQREGKRIILFRGLGYKNNNSIKRLIHTLIFSLKAFKYIFINRKEFTHIIISYPTLETLILLTPIINFYKKPLIIDIRDKWPPSTKQGLIYNIYKNLNYKILRKIHINENTFLLAVSEDLLNWFKNITNNKEFKNSAICPIGSNTPFLGYKEQHIKNQDLNFIYVGSLGINYDVKGIVKALIKLNLNCDYQIFINIVGKGHQLKDLKKLATNNHNLKLHGFLNEKEIRNISRKCQIGLCPHTIDGLLPNKLGEYLSYGLFIISTIKGNCQNLLDENKVGFTVDRNFLKLQDAINLYRQIDHNSTSKNIKEVYMNKFFSEKIYKDKMKNLNKFIEEKNCI